MAAPRARSLALLALPGLLVTACAPGPVAAAPSGPGPTLHLSAVTGPADGDEVAVAETLHRYYLLVLNRDLAGACALNAPETTETLLQDARVRGLPSGSCEEAMTAVLAAPGAAEVADGIVRTTHVQDVTVTGDTASVTWSGEATGLRRTVTTGMRRIDGGWKVVDAQ